jgi:diguanylate cyclase (GGDEF)-like protein
MRGLDIPEERRLAGRLAAALYLTGAVTGALLLVMPGVEVTSPEVVLIAVTAGLVWGSAALLVVPWERAHPLVTHLSSSFGLPIVVATMAATGGASSPARFYLMFIVFYASWFYPPRAAVVYVVLCIATHALPLAYDSEPVASGFAAELIVLVPTYLVLGGLIGASRSLLVRLRDESHSLSLTDALTGLANRRSFEAMMSRHVGGDRRTDGTGLLLIDLDDFKAANTLFGHSGGDRVLKRVAAALRESSRGNDLVARLGGDEFAIVTSGASAEGMGKLADRVLACLRRADEELALPGFKLSASVGFAVYPDHAQTADELIEHADFALSGAKAAGKDRSQAATRRQATSRSRPVSTS